MNDDDSGRVPDHGGGGDWVLYDYYKYLTSLCIFSLGGVLALADRVPAGGRGKELLVGALGVICVAGLLAFTGVGELARAQSERSPVRPSVVRYSSGAPMLLSVGVGMFTYLFVRSLFR